MQLIIAKYVPRKYTSKLVDMPNSMILYLQKLGLLSGEFI